MITCYVVDDEPLAVELMEAYVRKTPFLELKGSFGEHFKGGFCLLNKKAVIIDSADNLSLIIYDEFAHHRSMGYAVQI